MEGRHASAGAISLADNGKLLLRRCDFAQNDAGGSGIMEALTSLADMSAANRRMRASHIDTLGDVTLVDCTIASAPSSLECAAQAFVVARRSALVVLESVRLSSTEANAIALRLYDQQCEALVRSCDGTNVTIEAAAAVRLGVVHCDFSPPLPAGLLTIGPPDCGQPVAGLMSMCDPRARCFAEPTGGVLCACDGDGFSSKPGEPADGRQCLRATKIETLIATTALRIKVAKPGRLMQALIVSTRVEGEESFLSISTINSTLRRGDTVVAISASAQAFGFSFDGLVPDSMQPVQLDGNVHAFTWTSSSRVHIALNCSTSGDGWCAAGEAPSMPLRVPIRTALCHAAQAVPLWLQPAPCRPSASTAVFVCVERKEETACCRVAPLRVSLLLGDSLLLQMATRSPPTLSLRTQPIRQSTRS
jgi:hypothetical protein